MLLGEFRDFVRHEKLRLSSGRAVKLVQNRLKLACVNLGGIKSNERGRLLVRNRDRGGVAFPRERNCIGRVRNRGVCLLGRRCHCTVHDVNKLAVLVTLRVVAQDRRVAQCKARTILLADKHTLIQLRGAIAFREFVGVGIRFNSHLELFGRGEGEVLDVVGVNRGGFGTRGGFGNGLKTIPCHAILVGVR
nr:MAG TPA: hypothetical protein [Caudoviricetes sp.]